MTRTHLVSLLAIAAAVPLAVGSVFVSTASSDKPCFVAGATGYEVTAGSADATVRIDNAAANPSLRLQLVDDPAAADFVLVDDGDALKACKSMSTIKRVRLDPSAATPDLTVALSREPADTKIYVHSAAFSEQDAAALFAVIWQGARKTARTASVGRAF